VQKNRLRNKPRDAIFHPEFLDDIQFWAENDRKLLIRLLSIVRDVLRDPFVGIGKPEPLKRELTGAWSRRLDKEHRVIYTVSDDRIDFLQARYHY
jgi:toxin YoeB